MIDEIHDRREAFGRDEPLQGNGADQSVVVFHDEDVIDVFNFVLGDRNGLERVVDRGAAAHGNQLGLHDAARAVFRVLQQLLDLFGIVRLDGVENRLRLVIREFRDDIRRIVRIHLFDDIGELFIGEIFDELLAGGVGQLQNDFGGLVHFQQREEAQPVFLIEIVDQFGDIRCVKV